MAMGNHPCLVIVTQTDTICFFSSSRASHCTYCRFEIGQKAVLLNALKLSHIYNGLTPYRNLLNHLLGTCMSFQLGPYRMHWTRRGGEVTPHSAAKITFRGLIVNGAG